jgi:hypothetical protein
LRPHFLITHRDEKSRANNGLLENSGRLWLVYYSDERDEPVVAAVPWKVALVLAPEAVERALLQWRQTYPELTHQVVPDAERRGAYWAGA